MLRLWVKDNTNGKVHEYGTNRHDSLVLQEDGSLHYENIQCCEGTKYPEEGYSFCREDGTIPDITAVDLGDEYLDIGGCFFDEQDEINGLALMIDGVMGYFPKEFIVEAIKVYIKQQGAGPIKPNTGTDFSKMFMNASITSVEETKE